MFILQFHQVSLKSDEKQKKLLHRTQWMFRPLGAGELGLRSKLAVSGRPET